MTLPATVPPSTGSTVPVTYRERSVAKYSAASATSSTVPSRFSGRSSRICCADLRLELLQLLQVLPRRRLADDRVRMLPGAIALTRIS